MNTIDTKDTLNIIIIRGYFSKGDSVVHADVNGIKVKITTVALGRPVFVKRKLKRIIINIKLVVKTMI